MTLVTEYREELGEYEAVPIPGLRRADRDGTALLRRRSARTARRAVLYLPGPLPLGPHVTWLRLRVPDGSPLPPRGPEAGPFYRELGRWLGAYLTGPFRDQLL
jgi:hypothetical protein